MTEPNSRRRWLITAGIILAAGLAGYLIAWTMYPAPILPRRVLVPALRGTPSDSAIQRLERLGLKGRVADSVTDPLVRKGEVAWQSPVSETQLPEGSLVKLGVSLGSPIVAVPDVVDLDLGLALQVLGASGLTVGSVDTARNDAVSGTVLQTRPGPGSGSRPGAPVAITVSSGRLAVPVPSLGGLPLDVARQRIEGLGLRVGTIEQRPGGKAGLVVDQSPAPGALISRESPINLILAGGF